ncbi:hypothetical protein SEA_MORGANA_152 [Gordonia phage Morgana]|uniref:Uncharacterized protein n=1 Tax=Gordonia phage Morgana TaxID=3137292 RepID=A0AAX4RC02_9CAUD
MATYRVFFHGGSYTETDKPEWYLDRQDPERPLTRVVAVVDQFLTEEAGIGDAHRAVADFLGLAP